MEKPRVIAAAILALLSVPAAFASESIADQIDRIAPLVTAGELEQLGGPGSASDIVSGLSGVGLPSTIQSETGSVRAAPPDNT